MLGFLSIPAAVGSLRVADAVGMAVDRGFIGDGVYLRLSNTFWAGVDVRFASSELVAGYTFRLTPDPRSLRIAPYHIGDLRYTYATPRFSLGLSQGIGIGEQVFLGAGRANPLIGLMPTASPQPTAPNTLDNTLLPAALSLPVVLWHTDVALGYRWNRRWTSSLALGYSLYGGLTREAQKDLGLLHSLYASSTLTHHLNARTELATGLQFSRGWVTGQGPFALLVLSETWQHRLSKRTQLDVGGGLSVREIEEPTKPTILATTPVGSMGVTHALRGRDLSGSVRIALTYAPAIDVVSRVLQNRFNATTVFTLNYDDLYAGAGFGVSQTVPASGPNSVRYISTNVFSGYRFAPWLGASLSGVVSRQWIGAEGAPGAERNDYVASGLTWGVYGGVDAMLSVKRF